MSDIPPIEDVYDDWLMCEKVIFHAKQMERDRAELLSVLKALLEDYDATMKSLNECRMADGWDELAEEECAILARKTIDKMEEGE